MPIRLAARVAATLFLTVAIGAVVTAQSPPNGADLYRHACATCHGSDGRGNARSDVGFDVPLPDFTDCAFQTPEPDQDWLGVVRHGGPHRAFDRRMPAFGEALAEDEIVAVVSHIRSFCPDARWPRGELNLPRPLVTEKAFPENEAVLTVSVSTAGPDSIGHTLLYERRVGPRSQWEVAVPLDVRQSQAGTWTGGVGDVAFALKRVVFHSLARGSIVSVAGEIVLPTGSEANGLGKGVAVVEPFLAAGQMLPANAFVQLQTGLELSMDTSKADREAFVRVAAGRSYFAGRDGRSWTPMIELLAAKGLTHGEDTLWDVAPQLQVSLSRRQHVLLNAGVRMPVNERPGRRRTAMVYLLWDWFDGGLFVGWK